MMSSPLINNCYCYLVSQLSKKQHFYSNKTHAGFIGWRILSIIFSPFPECVTIHCTTVRINICNNKQQPTKLKPIYIQLKPFTNFRVDFSAQLSVGVRCFDVPVHITSPLFFINTMALADDCQALNLESVIGFNGESPEPSHPPMPPFQQSKELYRKGARINFKPPSLSTTFHPPRHSLYTYIISSSYSR